MRGPASSWGDSGPLPAAWECVACYHLEPLRLLRESNPIHSKSAFAWLAEPKLTLRLARVSEGWRRGWDSNPRAGYPTRRFRGAPVTTTSIPLRWCVESRTAHYTLPRTRPIPVRGTNVAGVVRLSWIRLSVKRSQVDSTQFSVDTLDSQAVDALPVAVCISDCDGRIVRFNQRARELWGRVPTPADLEQAAHVLRTGQAIR